jgi:hypothetical protein
MQQNKILKKYIKTLIPLILIFLLFSLWWVAIQIGILSEDFSHRDIFAATYGLTALYGAIIGIHISLKWGGTSSLVGKSLFLFSFGLLFQEFGQLAYSYYIYFQRIDIPYPSIGDIGYFGSIPIYILGVYYLSKASGTKLSSLQSKLLVILIPLVLLVSSYYIFLNGYQPDWKHPLAMFLDFAYPFGQAIYISLAILSYILSVKTLGGKLKWPVLSILIALTIQYFADFTFLYQANNGTWTTAGINDYMYLVSYFVMTFALLTFGNVLNKLNNGQVSTSN